MPGRSLEKEWALATSLATLAVLIAAASMVFAGLQTRFLARQTAVLSATSQLSYNLQILARLEDILFQIADDPTSHDHVWNEHSTHNRRPQVAAEALLDTLAMARAATARLPGFANHEDSAWDAYIDSVISLSSTLRATLIAHPDWWPELLSYVNRTNDEPLSNPTIGEDERGESGLNPGVPIMSPMAESATSIRGDSRRRRSPT
jgi:hypothetical protein